MASGEALPPVDENSAPAVASEAPLHSADATERTAGAVLSGTNETRAARLLRPSRITGPRFVYGLTLDGRRTRSAASRNFGTGIRLGRQAFQNATNGNSGAIPRYTCPTVSKRLSETKPWCRTVCASRKWRSSRLRA
jgi:hypothetical protein